MPNTYNWHHFVKFLYSIMWNIFVEFLVYITSGSGPFKLFNEIMSFKKVGIYTAMNFQVHTATK